MKITIQVCPKCYFWPMNGEERQPACKQCGNKSTEEGQHMPTISVAIGRDGGTAHV